MAGKKEDKGFLQKLREAGMAYPKTGPEGSLPDPLGNLLCDEVIKNMKDFCGGKIADELLLKKIEKHLKRSAISKSCDCAKKLL
ncbi:hypothetical protein C4572_01655 [Candidatus Parcubacteria bacterium]|nr:MAG: hypothetical protein C4572_01655 [Candidatus Parcubacteria bacterium]